MEATLEATKGRAQFHPSGDKFRQGSYKTISAQKSRCKKANFVGGVLKKWLGGHAQAAGARLRESSKAMRCPKHHPHQGQNLLEVPKDPTLALDSMRSKAWDLLKTSHSCEHLLGFTLTIRKELRR